jgi:poly-gamma-glutamate synthesis protein (capsule biosynthesis protein)
MKMPALGSRNIPAIIARRALGPKGVLGGVALVVASVAVVAVAASGFLAIPAAGARNRQVVAQATGFVTQTDATSPAERGVPTAAPSPGSTASPTPLAPTPVPLVPIVSFWSAPGSVSQAQLIGLWTGKVDAGARTGYKAVAVAAQDADALAIALGAARGNAVQLLSPTQIKAAVAASATTLGLIRADDVTPDIRALAVDGISLFGSGRIKDLTKWPILLQSATPTAFASSNEWTLAAGGDVNLSRRVHEIAVDKKKGPDFPWSAGYATTKPSCCGINKAPQVVARDVGPDGALRARFSDADLALVNLEGSAPDIHVNGRNNFVFTFDPALLVGLAHAGIDAVSLANNHIRNSGNVGVIQTGQHLDALGIAHAGAGANVTAARQPVWLKADGLRVAMLGYSAVGRGDWASNTHPGAAPLKLGDVTADIHAAKAAGADIVIVMPHWGTEFSYVLSTSQKSEAAAFVAAGADLVLGSHSHWVGAIQSLPGPNGPAFVDYSMGDLIFTLNHDTQAQEGVIVNLTFSGKRLAQVELDPTVMIDGSRVGLLAPGGNGKAVLDAIRKASRKTSKW